jgi:cytochrome c biogenesis protein CcdA
MSSALYAPLVVLALIDSTSFGTLVIPIWLMLAPGRLRAGRILVYLFTIAAFYLVLGVVLTVGAMAVLDQLRGVLGRTPAQVFQLLVGIVLLVLGLTVEPLTKAGKAKRAAKRDAKRADRGPDRIQRWRVRGTTAEGSASGLMMLAITAAAIEAASMVPYLAAVALITTSDLSIAQSVAVLAGYCLVMVAPAIVILTTQMVLHERISPALGRFEGWLSRNSREAIAWVLFLLGLYLTAGAVDALLDT